MPSGSCSPRAGPRSNARVLGRARGLQPPDAFARPDAPAPALLRLLDGGFRTGDLSRMFTLSSGCPGENCRIFLFRFNCPPFPLVSRTFRKLSNSSLD